jgi:hypothetical protein
MGHPLPWTSDPIIANNRFCNVHREDDKVTMWISNWLTTGPLASAPFALALARMVNWPDTLEQMGFPHDGWTPEYRQQFLDTFADRRVRGLKSWTGAYMVTGGYSKGGETKEVIIARVLDGAWERTKNFPTFHTLEAAHAHLMVPGIGSFLAAQIVADLKNTPHLEDTKDWWSWCAPGPGSTMGLNFLMDRPRTTSIAPQQFIQEVNQVQQVLWDRMDLRLCAQNTQNCLCELSKYIRAKHFGERLKNSYSPS